MLHTDFKGHDIAVSIASNHCVVVIEWMRSHFLVEFEYLTYFLVCCCCRCLQGKATGNIRALRCRVCLQHYLVRVGRSIERHCGKVVFLGLLLLSLCCVGLKTATLETKIEDLWVEGKPI